LSPIHADDEFAAQDDRVGERLEDELVGVRP
jgi:hypothetical protein